jgi:hypothetical protein
LVIALRWFFWAKVLAVSFRQPQREGVAEAVVAGGKFFQYLPNAL